MQNSASKPKANKLPPSQFIGFVKRHRAPAVDSVALPKITNSPNREPEQLPLERAKPLVKLVPMLELKKMSAEAVEPQQKTRPVEARWPERQMMAVEGRPLEKAAQSSEEVKEVVLKVAAPEVAHAREMVEEKQEARAVAEPSVADTVSVPDECETVSFVSSTKTAEDKNKATTEGSASPAKPEVQKTPEECQQAAEAMVEKCRAIANKTHTVPVKSPDSPLYLKEFMTHLTSIQQTKFIFRDMPLSLLRKSELEVADSLLCSGTVKILCDTVSDVCHSTLLFSEDQAVAKNHRIAVQCSLSTLMHYSDCSDDITYSFRDHPSFLQAVLSWLQEWSEPHLIKELKAVMEKILLLCLSVVHNTVMREDNVHRLRELGAPSIFLPYLQSHNDIYKLSAYASLADIVSEEEADKLSTSPDQARFLLKCLENALQSKDHRCFGWSITELVRAVRRLARNDANKRLLVKEGVLPLLSKGVRSSFEDEQIGCMEAVWMLSFDKQNVKEIMKCDELLDTIVQTSTDHSHPPALRHAAAGILWQCRHDMAESEKYSGIAMARKAHRRKRPSKGATTSQQNSPLPDDNATKAVDKIEEEAEDVKQEEEESVRHVMLSYQWADQKVVTQIRDVLHAKGFRVWMDIDNMGGSTLQAMAAAIEEAFMVLICMSQKYKDSPNCRAEAEYAFQLRKTIVPLIMETNYRPDGWLGMILGAKLFYDFSGKYTFESRAEGLVKAVASAAGQLKGEDNTDGKTAQCAEESKGVEHKEPLKFQRIPDAVAVGRSMPPPPAHSVNVDKVKAWSAADVKKWLMKFGLNGTELQWLTGGEIAFLHRLRAEAPEFFFRTIDKKLHITTLSGLMSFTDALDDLPAN